LTAPFVRRNSALWNMLTERPTMLPSRLISLFLKGLLSESASYDLVAPGSEHVPEVSVHRARRS
jgi:hypothetical protein